jgi:amino acid adenylation domain-containing protein
MTVAELLQDLSAKGVWVWSVGDSLKFSVPDDVPFSEVQAALKARKQEILEYLNRPSPLSFSQERFWLLEQISPGTTAYILPAALRLRGNLNVQALRKALEAVIDRHEVLRSVFISQSGQVVQLSGPAAADAIRYVDLSGEPETEILRSLACEARKPIDLEHGPVFRATICRVAPNEHIVALVMHHIAADGWSVGILWKEIGTAYRSFASGSSPDFPDNKLRYGDYARWQRRRIDQGDGIAEGVQYWRSVLESAPKFLDLPLDRPRPSRPTHRGGLFREFLPSDLAASLRGFARDQGCTLNVVMIAAFALVLSRFSGQRDLLVGMPVSNREAEVLESLVGCFINTLLLRAEFPSDLTVSDFLGRVRDSVLNAISRQQVPFEKLVKELGVERDVSRNPLFQVLFTFEDAREQAGVIPGISAEPVVVDTGGAQLDLALTVQDFGDGIRCIFSFAADIFNRETIEQFASCWITALRRFVENSSVILDSVDIVDEVVREKVLSWGCGDVRQYPDTPFHTMFGRIANASPDLVAIRYLGESITYRALNDAADRIAGGISAVGAAPEIIVGLYFERSPKLIAAMLGVLKAGAAFLPLDPRYPPERLRWIIEDSGVNLVIGDRPDWGVPESVAQFLSVDDLMCEHSEASASLVESRPSSLAYVIYTSGSTGNPKGTLIEHRGLTNFANYAPEVWKVGPDQRVLQFASMSFDASILEIVWALAHGGTLVMAPQEILHSWPKLIELLRSERVTAAILTPSFLRRAKLTELPDLVYLTVGGEECPRSLVDTWAGGRKFLNGYGPTEATITLSFGRCEAGAEVSPSIGSPLPNTRAYVVNEQGHLLPPGVPGELLIGGVGVARGYLGRPNLTEERFVADPFLPGSRVYKTGDRVRWRCDGELEFLGRFDSQVKIRGNRIELGEIEAVLESLGDVVEVAVVAHGESADKRLVAYVVLRGEVDRTVSDLRKSLAEKLPNYMVPDQFVVLSSLPTTPSGKVDRNALPTPDLQQLSSQVDFREPTHEQEKNIARVWQEVLEVEKVGLLDNFFQLGGDSISIVVVAERLREHFPDLQVAQLFEHPTLQELAGFLSGNDTRSELNTVPDRAGRQRAARGRFRRIRKDL